MSRPTAVALDLDGCIVDSTAAILPSVQSALATEGLPVLPEDELRWLIGPPMGAGLAELLVRLGEPASRAPALLATYRAAYRRVMLERTTLVAGMGEAVARIAGQRPVCVVTSKPAVLAEPILEHLGLRPLLALVEGPSLDEPAETKAETLARALTQLPIGVMVGDRHHDVDAGRAHGLTTVGVTWGVGSAAELGEAGADHLVARPADLPAVVGA